MEAECARTETFRFLTRAERKLATDAASARLRQYG